jgi:hypothetical protein
MPEPIVGAAAPPSETRQNLVAFAAFSALLFAILFIVPLLLAVPLFFIARSRLRRVECAVAVLIAALYLVLFARVWVPRYWQWLLAIAGRDSATTAFGPPWLALAAATTILVCIPVLLSGVRLFSFGLGSGRIQPGMLEEILPTEREKSQLQVVAAPGAALLPDAAQHSLESHEMGKRSFPIGIGKDGTPVLISEAEIRTHGLIFGSTGSGKTETIKVVAAGLLDLGWSGMILDLKEDAATGGLLDWCTTYADYHAIGFQSFRVSDPTPKYWFNVLYGMGPDEARDTILASQEFEAAYYRALNEKQLGQLITLLYAAHEVDPVKYPQPTVYSIGKILSAPDLPAATRETVATVVSSVPAFVKDDFDSLVRPEKAMVEAAGGLGARLTAMYETQAGRLALRGGSNEREAFDVTKKGLSYVGLDSMGKPEITRLVSASVLRRMAVYAADRSTGKVADRSQRFLIVDEANFVNRRLLLELLSRARSAGIACIVCTQGPTDWQAPAPGEPDLTSLVQNTNVAIIMSQGERTNAELCADIIGRGEKIVMNHRLQDGMLTDSASIMSKEDYLVSPDAMRSLTVGEAIVRVGKPAEWRRYTKVIQRDPKLLARSR